MSIYHQILGVPAPSKVEVLNTILEKYYLEPSSMLINYQEGTNGVDCWFDSPQWRQHRCLSFEDFKLIKS